MARLLLRLSFPPPISHGHLNIVGAVDSISRPLTIPLQGEALEAFNKASDYKSVESTERLQSKGAALLFLVARLPDEMKDDLYSNYIIGAEILTALIKTAERPKSIQTYNSQDGMTVASVWEKDNEFDAFIKQT